MPITQCPKCGGGGKITVEKPIASDLMGTSVEDCDLCDGIGWLAEDATPLVVEQLKEIKEILLRIEEAIK